MLVIWLFIQQMGQSQLPQFSGSQIQIYDIS